MLAREALTNPCATASLLAAARESLPVEGFGAPLYFEAPDVVRVAVALAVESIGGTFDAGARLAYEAEVESVLEHTGPGDLFAIATRLDDGTLRHLCGGLDHANAAPIGAIVINVSAVMRQLKAEARRLGLDLALGWHAPLEAA
jgi:hypothetical protein